MFDCLDAAVHRIVAASVPEILEGLTLRATQSARPKVEPATETATRLALAKRDRGMRKIAAELGVGTVQRVAAELKAA
jgi:hypothetical protein